MRAQLWRPHLLLRYAKRGYFMSAFFVLFIGLYNSVQQYRVWQASSLFSKYADWDLIKIAAHYDFTNFLINPLIALGVSGIAWFGLWLLNRRSKERFFEKPEPYLFATGIVLSGHPNWIFYTVSVFFIAVAFSVARFISTRSRDVIFSFYWFWLPVAIGTIIIRICLNTFFP